MGALLALTLIATACGGVGDTSDEPGDRKSVV